MSNPTGLDVTPLSLLEEVALAQGSTGWERFVFLYEPFLYSWLKRFPLQPSDAADLVQETLLIVVRRIPEFRHNGHLGAFRAWLRTILANQFRSFLRKQNRHPTQAMEVELVTLESVSDRTKQEWDRQHDLYLLGRLLLLVRPQFHEQTWMAFERTMLHGEPPLQVASDLGLSLNAVYIARSKVLSRIRALSQGLLSLDEEA